MEEKFKHLVTPTNDRLVLVMVGLPARGKSFIAKKLHKFLSWKGLNSYLFNVGRVRRSTSMGVNHDSNFFNQNNTQATKKREEIALITLEKMFKWFENENGQVAIFDATNTTKIRRNLILNKCNEVSHLDIKVVFIESICTNDTVLNNNIKQKVLSSPDFRNMNINDGIIELKKRIENYEAVYEALDDEEDNLSYIKLFNLQSRVHANKIYGRIAKSLLPYMMSIHIGHRPIWLVRAGHCTAISTQDIGSIDDKIPCVVLRTCHLSEFGLTFAKKLKVFVEDYLNNNSNDCNKIYGNNHVSSEDNKLLVMTSTLPRAVETVQFLYEDHMNENYHHKQIASLNPLDKGDCYGWSMEQMKETLPEQYELYLKNPLKYRFPGGESYYDLMTKLEPILIDIEQHTGPVLLVSHISTLQVLYSYFLGVAIEDCVHLSIPFHSVLQLIPNDDGWTNTVVPL